MCRCGWVCLCVCLCMGVGVCASVCVCTPLCECVWIHMPQCTRGNHRTTFRSHPLPATSLRQSCLFLLRCVLRVSWPLNLRMALLFPTPILPWEECCHYRCRPSHLASCVSSETGHELSGLCSEFLYCPSHLSDCRYSTLQLCWGLLMHKLKNFVNIHFYICTKTIQYAVLILVSAVEGVALPSQGTSLSPSTVLNMSCCVHYGRSDTTELVNTSPCTVMIIPSCENN